MTRIYYWKNEYLTLLMGWTYLEAQNPNLAKKLQQHYLDDTHILLVERNDSKNLEELYIYYQGEMWSPNGEATPLIEEKKLGHTSMSVGDIIEQNGKFFFCDTLGFKEIYDVD